MKLKKLVAVVAIAALAMLPCQSASAASVIFSNFSYTSTPNWEAWKKVTRKTKADNEQNWYVTLTDSAGLSTTKCRAMFNSSTTNNSLHPRSAPVPLYKNTTRCVQSYYIYTPKGSDCKLYIHGDENAKVSYTVKVSGRYTS